MSSPIESLTRCQPDGAVRFHHLGATRRCRRRGDCALSRLAARAQPAASARRAARRDSSCPSRLRAVRARVSPTRARSAGPSRRPPPSGWRRPGTSTTFAIFPWHLIPSLSADIFAVMFVTAITMLLNTTGIELVTRREANLQREMTTLGVANLVAAGLRRLCQLHFAEPDDADLCRRRPQSPVRPGRGGGLGADADGRSGLPRLHPQIRARRPAALSRREPDV